MRVMIVATGDVSGTRVHDTETGESLACKSVSFSHEAGKSPEAVVELVGPQLSGEAKAKFAMKHPASGELKRIKRIEFEDGSSFGE